MNTTKIRRTAATLATTAAVATALTTVSAVAPSSASAHRADPFPRSTPHRLGGVGDSCTVDIALEIGHRKALMAQYYVDNARELQQRAAR